MSLIRSVSSRDTRCTFVRWLSIVGIGEDGVAGLSATAKRLIGDAETVYGGARHLTLAQPLIRGIAKTWASPIGRSIEEISAGRGRATVVLASGDPFHFGVGKQLAERVAAAEMLCLPQPSAYSLAASRMMWPIQDTTLVTLHGRVLEGVVRHLHHGARILALSWDRTTPAKLANFLMAQGFGDSQITVLEAMGGLNERVRTGTAHSFDLDDIADLNTIALSIAASPLARTIPLTAGLPDEVFEHDGQLTKRDIRAVTLGALAPRPGDLLWDIGLGAGSVAIEWLLADPSLRAIGFEQRADRAARAARNAATLGTPDLQIVEGAAPQSLAGLPAPDAVFIGGGFGDAHVFDAAWAALKPGGRLVANAVSIETEARLSELFQSHGGDLVRISVARAEPVGSMHGWRPAMPVTQWRVRKP